MALERPKGPGIAGFSWISHDAWEHPLEYSIPVGEQFLSIIHLRIVSDTSVRAASTPTARLWLATLEYISTIPGCAAIYWGTETSDDNSIYLLVQWEDPLSWRRFQKSIALSLMRYVLVENPTNRCAPLLLPANLTVPQTITSVNITFLPGSEEVERDEFLKTWEKLEASWIKKGIEFRREWLEEDVTCYVQRSPLARIDVQKRDFFALIFSDKKTVMENIGDLDQISLFSGKESVIRYTLSAREFLLNPTPKWGTSQPDVSRRSLGEADILTSYGFGSLLKLDPYRHYSQKTGVDCDVDAYQADTISAVWRGERKFPSPHGNSPLLTGEINQYKLPILKPPSLTELENSPWTIYFVWLAFKPEVYNTNHVPEKIEDYIWKIRPMEGCGNVVWFSSIENRCECGIIIYWSDSVSHASASQSVHDTTMEFMNTTSSLLHKPQIFSFTSYGSYWGPYTLVEIVTIEVFDDPRDRILLQEFWASFCNTSGTNPRPGVGRPEPKACANKKWFWHSEPFNSSSSPDAESRPRDGKERIFLTACIAWTSEEAMQSWSTDYRDGIRIYERLGHQIDSLQLVCPEVKSARSVFMDLDFNARTPRRGYRRSQKAQRGRAERKAAEGLLSS